MPDTDPNRVTVLVNGRREEVRTEQDTALLYVLRNHLGLKGTRFGCGLGLCGTCLVLVDGQPAYSCDTPMWAVADGDVTTVEGLGTPERPHPVARAIIDGQAAQCGYCISGVVISAAALLAANDNPSEGEVRAALDGNLCRCGAHNRIVRAVLAAAASLRASQDGAGQDGAGQDGAGQDGAGQDGAGQDGAGQDGASQDGASRDGASRDGD